MDRAATIHSISTCTPRFISVNLATGQSNTIENSALARVLNIENLIGSSTAGSTILGDAGDNILVGGSGDDTIIGGLGNDTYLFQDNWGHDTIIELASQGNDTISFSGNAFLDILAATAPLTFNLNPGFILITDPSGNGVTYTNGGTSIENLIGGSNDDTFVFSDNVGLAGTLNGGAGKDILDYSSYIGGRDVLLTSLGSVDGFAGTELSLGIGFDNIETIPRVRCK